MTDSHTQIGATIGDTRSAITGLAPVLDVVIPVYNEQATLAACVHRLHDHLEATFPYPFRITIADNASTDATWLVAEELSRALPVVAAVHMDAKGRGRALKAVWSASDASILAYMDVDLSTDLDGLYPLVAPLMSGHSDLAIGSRLASGSRVVRGDYREFVSRSYNLILRTTLGARFTDAQCGFKAIRSDVATELLPYVEDTAWFFDTELLVLAEKCGLRIHEVPVDWYDDPDSRVDVSGTARDDLRGIARVRRSLGAGRIPVEEIAARIGRGPLRAGILGQAGRFAVVGAASTLLNLGLFAAFRAGGMGDQSANLLALVLATVANTAVNRTWTFGVKGRRGALLNQVQGLAIFVLTWGLSAVALEALAAFAPGAGTGVATAVVAAANLLATVMKFFAFRQWMKPEGPAVTFPERPVVTTDAHGGTALDTPSQSTTSDASDSSDPFMPSEEATRRLRVIA